MAQKVAKCMGTSEILFRTMQKAETMTKQTLAKILTYAGIIPFVVLAKLSIFDVNLLHIATYPLLLVYAAVIAAFISGIHWGLYLFKDAPVNLFIHSNIVTLVAWVAAAGIVPLNVFVLAGCFVYLYAIDIKLVVAGVTEPWFHRLRTHASYVVILSLLLVALIR
jgi:hypothetical protein